MKVCDSTLSYGIFCFSTSFKVTHSNCIMQSVQWAKLAYLGGESTVLKNITEQTKIICSEANMIISME